MPERLGLGLVQSDPQRGGPAGGLAIRDVTRAEAAFCTQVNSE